MEQEDKYISFWIRDIHGNLIEHTCKPATLNNICVNDKPNEPFDITPVYFKREVLSKYYNAPHRYNVSDGQVKFLEEGFNLRVDTDMRDYVAVLLVDLAKLDYNEQMYWRSANIKPDEDTTISKTACNRWYGGQVATPVAPDAILVQKYREFYTHWEAQIGWHLFIQSPEDKQSELYSIHMLSDEDNEKEFFEQILVVSKLFIESLNVNQFPKLDKEENRGLNRFNAYMKQNGIDASGMIEFLRYIQRLRSAKAAHNGKVEKKVSEYFGFDKSSYGFILGSIYATLVQILGTLSDLAIVISARND